MSARDRVRRSLVIIDDDRGLTASLRDGLARPGLDVLAAGTAREGMALCREHAPEVVLLDEKLPDASGATLCRTILEHHDPCKIIFMTAFPSYDNAVAALRAGAHDYLSKPFELDELLRAVDNALSVVELERIAQLRVRRLQQERADTVFVAESPAMAATLHLARLAAETDAPVLISGETGTGKTLLARFIHYASGRASRDLVSVNCGSLPESLAESELFGHERGAFTGASGARRGIFEMAGEGSVLLDEIGAMPIQLQPKLLTVLEDRAIRRIGGEATRRVDIRLLAATNTDLQQAMAEGSFRRDLFYRLSVMPIHLPPLRERPEDIRPLCRHLLGSVGGAGAEIADDEIARMEAYPWPGNVRELRNVLERALIVQPDQPLRPSALLARDRGEQPVAGFAPTPEPETLDAVERRHILAAVHHHGGNLARTARTLGIALSTLKRKLDRYGWERS